MKILLIGNYPPDRQESMLRFAALLHRELSARGHSVTLAQPRAVLHHAGIPARWSKWVGYLDKFVIFPRRLRALARQHQITHLCDHSNAFYVHRLRGLPHLITCHDVLAIKSALREVPQNVVSATGRQLQARILAGLRAARYIVCDSEITRQDMLRVTGRPAETSEVLYLSQNYPYSPMPRAEALGRLATLGFDASKPFFVHVGGDFWYKNRTGLLRIFERLHSLLPNLRPRLLLIGGALQPESLTYLERVGLRDQVFQLSGISNEDLRAAYALSEGLIYPSLQEGFGWPVLEAQACGCPVFASNRAPMTETGAEAALYFDPEDIDGAASIIANGMALRPELRARGILNVKRFSVQKMIDGYLEAYARVETGAMHRQPFIPGNGEAI